MIHTMSKMRANSPQAKGQVAGDETPLILKVAGTPSLYHFSPEVVQAHRHMITRLKRDNRLAGRLSVVSALRGEGVTFSSLALATALSHDFSQNVCYVDLNWWWPAAQMAEIHRQSQGIAGILNHDARLEEALLETENANLHLLPAGQLSPEERPVIARSTALKELLAQVSAAFDTVVLDIPAILATSDAIALAAQGDTCLVVVRQGVTATPSIKQALNDIANMPITGVLLNRVHVATPSWILSWIPDL